MLEVDPDKIFEEKSISEIEALQKKIQDEAERKREELRTMVGWVNLPKEKKNYYFLFFCVDILILETESHF